MRKHGGTPSRRDKHVTLAAISPPGVARGRFVGGQQSGLAGSKPPPLFTREASSCSSQGRHQWEPWGASPRPSAPTYLPTYSIELLLVHITCLDVYYCLHIPSSLAQDARLCHGRGKDPRILWRYPNSRRSLGFHGFGDVHAKKGLEVALPPNASKEFCRRQGHQGGVTACGRRRRPDCRSTPIADR